MPRRGRHRRCRPGPVSRASLTVTAGGAGLAIPLIGATAHAAPADLRSAAVCESSGRDAGAAREVCPAEAGPAPDAAAARANRGEREERENSGTRTHVVTAGDTLSGIAAERNVRGGWQALYKRNRAVVGDDPDLVLPGQRLSLPGGPAAPERPAVRGRGGGDRESGRGAQGSTASGTGAHAQDRSAPRAAPTSPGTPSAPSAPPEFTAPVRGFGPGTPYRAVGSGWAAGYHTGVDFPVPAGTPVAAVSQGRVVSAGWAGAYGYQVVVRHTDGRYSQYAHLSAVSVRAGQRVGGGQWIGRSGSTGNSTGPHLHFEVRTGPGYGTDIDPLAYLRAGGVRL